MSSNINHINFCLTKKMLRGICVGVIAWHVRKIDALKLRALLMTQWILCPAWEHARDHYWQKGWENARGWLFSQYDSLAVILLFSTHCNLFAFWCIFRPLASQDSHVINLPARYISSQIWKCVLRIKTKIDWYLGL